MEIKEAIYKRRSIRKFKDQKVDEKIIEELLHLAMAAPSAVNARPWEFYVVENPSVLNNFYLTFQSMHYHAPLAIVVCANELNIYPKAKDYWIQDCSAAIENILLGALSFSLGSVWCGITPQEEKVAQVKRILSLGDNIIPLGLVYLGYPDEEKEPRDQYDKSKVRYIK